MKSTDGLNKYCDVVVKSMHQGIQDACDNFKKKFPEPKVSDEAKMIVDLANLIFDGIEDRHSEEGMATIFARLVEHKDKLKTLNPTKTQPFPS